MITKGYLVIGCVQVITQEITVTMSNRWAYFISIRFMHQLLPIFLCLGYSSSILSEISSLCESLEANHVLLKLRSSQKVISL